jgi:hypothetical protein
LKKLLDDASGRAAGWLGRLRVLAACSRLLATVLAAYRELPDRLTHHAHILEMVLDGNTSSRVADAAHSAKPSL